MGPERIDKPVHPNKWLPGDTIRDDTVVSRSVKFTTGVVDYMNRTQFGITKRGVPLYMMWPIDAGIPPFLVASKTKPAHNVCVTASYEHWTDTWPRGGIQRVIGQVGDQAVERQALLLAAGVEGAPVVATPEILTPVLSHSSPVWDVVLHIDPEGCADVDDVLAWRRGADDAGDADVLYFAIAIADVAAWVDAGSPLDIQAAARGQTIYDDGAVVVPMLPHIISTGLASMRRDGLARPVLALEFELRDGKVVGSAWRQYMMTVTESYTYDSVARNTDRCAQLREYLGAVCDTTLPDDSHIWIERAMVLYNRRAAETLAAARVGLLRCHKGQTFEGYHALAEATGCADLAWLGLSAGEYVRPDANYGHTGLSMEFYCHASSPLRRYSDLVNQRWLKHLSCGGAVAAPTGSGASGDAFALNERARIIKKVERDLWFLKHLDSSRIITASGFVIAPSKRASVWSVYVPTWRRQVKCVSEVELQPGCAVTLRAFTNLKEPQWSKRLVINASLPRVSASCGLPSPSACGDDDYAGSPSAS